jgi:carboxylesterase
MQSPFEHRLQGPPAVFDALRPRPGQVAGTEPFVVVGEPGAAAGRTGVLLLHGLSGSPWELRPLAEACAREGWAVALPCLPGHGTHIADLDASNEADWLRGARQGLRWLEQRCDRLLVVGFSMGGLLALRMVYEQAASQPDRRFARVVLVAPAVCIFPHQQWAARYLAPWLPLNIELDKGDPQLPGGKQMPAYRTYTLRMTAPLARLMDATVQSLAPLGCPARIVFGTGDPTVPYERARSILERGLGREGTPGAPSWYLIEGIRHIVMQERGAQRTIADTVDFLAGR